MSELWSRLLDYATYEWVRENSEIADDLESAGRQLAQLQRELITRTGELQTMSEEKAALQAYVNELRDAISHSVRKMGGHLTLENALDKTPAQSLADRDMQIAEKVREACALQTSSLVNLYFVDNETNASKRIRNLNLSEVISDEA